MAFCSTKVVVLLFLHVMSCTSDIEPRVHGGKPANITKFPHSVYLTAECRQRSWICGASVLNQKILLTAAHCLEGCVGRYNINAYAGHDTIGQMKIVRKLSKYMVHRDYDAIKCNNDIAVGYVSPDFPLGKHIQRVILMRTFPDVTQANVAGWGLDETATNTNQLKWVAQNLQPRRVCKQLGKLSKGMMCATNAFDCYPSNGDSGSALILSNGVQIGVVSFKDVKLPTLIAYSNVSYYYEWIVQSAKKLYCIAA